MKRIGKYAKTVINNQRGTVLAMSLILMCVGALLIPPMLQFRGSMLTIDVKNEESLKGRYAADAGINEVIWKFANNQFPDVTAPLTYDLPGKVNNMDVQVEIKGETPIGNITTYTLKSIAKLGEQEKGKVISQIEVTYISGSSPNPMLRLNAITSSNEIDIGENLFITGVIAITDEHHLHLDPDSLAAGSTLSVKEGPIDYWPDADVLKDFYWNQVENTSPRIPISISGTIDPGYNLLNNVNVGGNIKLDGTVYIEKNLTFNNNITINLNGNTIFVEGDIGDSSNGLKLVGSGCIIALGDISFKNNPTTYENEFVFIMSVSGNLKFKNNLTWYGSIAGEDIDLKNSATIYNDSPTGGSLNFPSWDSGDDDDYPGDTVPVKMPVKMISYY
jgi:hypothetical protein